MYIDVRDHLRNSIQVTFSLDSTFGDVRNAVNCCLPPGFVVTEFELVPAPFAHYIEDDPECFKGPADEWYIVDVFFDDIAAGLERCEKDETVENLVVCLRLVSIAPLGPPHRVGVLFPGERDLDAAAVEALLSKPEGEHALRLLNAAAEVRGYDLRKAFASGSRSDARAKRDATIVMSLATVEMRMKLRAVWKSIFNITSMCMYATVSMQALRLCFKNSTRAIDSSKHQPNRLRFDRDREV